MSDLRFQQQVTITVSEVLNLYYDLIAYREQAEVMRQGLKMSRQLLESNRKRLDLGLALQSDVNESERFVDNDAQALQSAEVQVAEQELTLKSVLTRRGLEDPRILTAPDQFRLIRSTASQWQSCARRSNPLRIGLSVSAER